MKLLIIKMSSLGDIVQAREALACVPDVEVDWVVEKQFEELLSNKVHRVITADTKKWRKAPFKWRNEIKAFVKELRAEDYDLIVDLQGNIKSSLVLACVRGRKKIGFGVKTVPEKINLFFTSTHVDPPAGRNIREDYLFLLEKGLHFVSDFEKHSGQKKYDKVLVCPFSAWKNKQLPIPQLIEFMKLFQAKFHSQFSILWGTENERLEAEELQKAFPGSVLIPKLSLSDLEKKMRGMDFVIAMDSFPLHLAGDLKIRSLGFFGPTSAIKYNPIGEDALFFQGECPYEEKFVKRCPIMRKCATGACLREKTGEEIWNLIKDKL